MILKYLDIFFAPITILLTPSHYGQAALNILITALTVNVDIFRHVLIFLFFLLHF